MRPVARRANACWKRRTPRRAAMAAQIPHPIYESESDYERLLRVLEIEVLTSDDPLEKIGGLEAAMRTAETSLSDSKRASTMPSARCAPRWATANSNPGSYTWSVWPPRPASNWPSTRETACAAIVPEIFDGDVQLAVTLKRLPIWRDISWPIENSRARVLQERRSTRRSQRQAGARCARVAVRRDGRRAEPPRENSGASRRGAQSRTRSASSSCSGVRACFPASSTARACEIEVYESILEFWPGLCRRQRARGVATPPPLLRGR